MRHCKKLRLMMLGISISMLATGASADAGVPMLFVTFPAMLLALIPIVLLEVIVMGRVMGGNASSFVKSAAIANVVSTIVGIPLTWLILVLLEWMTGGSAAYGISTTMQKFLAVTWQAPWLIPYGRQQLSWMIPTASLFLLVPFFFTSYLIEAPIVAHIKRDLSRTQVRAAVFRANIASYAGLAVVNVCWLVWALSHAPRT